MRRFFLISLVLIPRVTSAQISHGTFIAINYTKDQVTVAADSLSINGDTGKPNDPYCKIAALGSQFIFTSSGGTDGQFPDGSGRSHTWNNTALAREATKAAPEDPSSTWTQSVSVQWASLCALTPDKCLRVSNINPNKMLTVGTFIKADNLADESGAIFFDPSKPKPITFLVGTEGDCLPCGEPEGSRVCLMGGYFDAAQQFCSEREKGAKVRIHTKLNGTVTDSVRLPVKLAEMSITAHPNELGGPIDVVTITKGGITWNALKKECPKD